MNQLRQILDNLPGKSNEDALTHNIVTVMKEFGYTLEEMKALPLSTFSIILDILEEERKRSERDMKKSQRKR